MLLVLLQVWAYGGSLVALWFTGKKSPLGPLLGIMGFIPWSLLALHSGLWPMIGYNLILTSVNVHNWLAWKGVATRGALGVDTNGPSILG